jgi:hypothetical protein
MNERIKELEKRATTVVEGWSDENGTTRYYEFNREKFAELIVKECAAVARITPCPYTDAELLRNHGHTWDMACVESGELIIKHFGVEK